MRRVLRDVAFAICFYILIAVLAVVWGVKPWDMLKND